MAQEVLARKKEKTTNKKKDFISQLENNGSEIGKHKFDIDHI